jgi:hypothetical protein
MPCLSKSLYLRGLQCPKLLWHSFHKPEAVAVAGGDQAVLAQGREVGTLAKGLFPNGIEVAQGSDSLQEAFDRTGQALKLRRPLFEAAFSTPRARALVDLLAPAGVSRWNLLEVKSSTSAKAIHCHDLAFQVRVLRDCGVNVRRAHLVHVNSEYIRRGDIDPEQFFTRQDMTDQIDELLPGVEDQIDEMQTVVALRESPEVPIGPHCDAPYYCPLHNRCWAHLPEHSVLTLVRIGAKAFKLYEQGFADIRQLPDSCKLTPAQSIQREAVMSGRPHIDRPALATFLKRLKYPLHFLDFETVGPAIPLFDGTRPFEAVPFQFSLHIQREPSGGLEHRKYLANGASDPRRGFMERLRAALGDGGSVVVWNAAFEKGVLSRCAETLPEFRPWVTGVKRRVVDLLTPFKSFHYYHPQQHGSSSIKAVMPALTGRGYGELDIQEGATASQEFLRVTFSNVPAQERESVRHQLEIYCGRDTEGMVWILDVLRTTAAS